MLLIKRARLVAAAAVVTVVGLSSAPQITSAQLPQGTIDNGDPCYTQVPEYQYERPITTTEYEYVKEVRGQLTHGVDDWAPFGWIALPDGGSQWSASDIASLDSGPYWGSWTVPHGDHSDTYHSEEYRYVQSGQTRQVPTGDVETTGWLSGPPAGDGWVQIGQHTIDGDQIPCGDPPTYKPDVVEEYGDCVTGDDVVTGTRTTTNYRAEYNYTTLQWDKVPDGDPIVETITRPLTDAEQESCSDTPPTTAPPTTTPTTTPPTTAPEQPAPTVKITAVIPVCHRDAPYIRVTVGGDAVFNGRAGTITLLDVNGATVGEHAITFQAGETHEFLYPGAEVDADGNPTDWPGWAFVDGQWVPDASDAQLREGLTVVLTVNPADTATVAYPSATEGCELPEQVSSAGPETPGTAGMMLPATGATSAPLVAVGAAMLLAGAGMLAGGRVRKTEA